ncbi:MAG TPA: cation:proton antiporter [Longimicrobiaceae bacterium]|nr:cation:proton antiporter [Longimicrobiaceae bacterium]
MIAIAVLLAGAAVGFGIARWLRVPAIPLLLLTGFVLARLRLLPEAELLQEILVLGITFLVFVAGIELNPSRVGEQRRAALRVGAAQFFVLGAAGLLTALALGFALETSLYLALALTASSTLVVVRLLQQRRQLFEPFGRLVIGVLLLQDLLVILLIPVITLMQQGAAAAGLGLLSALLLMGLAFLSLRWITPILLLRFEFEDETLLLVVLALLFLFVGLANWMRLPLVAGAFLAGVSLSAFPVSAVVRGQLHSISDFFLAIFFTALGGFLLLPTGLELLHSLVFIALLLLLTPLLVTVVAERTGLAARPAIESGLLLAQASEFSLIVGLQGLATGQIEPGVFTVIALVTVLTMILTPFVATDRVTWRLMALHPLRQEGRPPSPPEDHILLLGCGDNGMPLLETLVSAGHDVLVVDDDPAVIQRLREGEIPCIRGDGADFEVLQAAGAQRARIIISTMRRPGDNTPMLEYVHDVPVLVRVFDPEDAERIRALGGTPVLYSRAAAEDFLKWLAQAERVGLARERRKRPRTDDAAASLPERG